MANELIQQTDFGAIEAAVFNNDISKLSLSDRAQFLGKLAISSGLNPLTQPFQIIKLNGRDTVYATKGAAQQLAMKNGISIKVTTLQVIDDCLECHVEGTMQGRTDSEIGLVPYSKSMGAADKCNAKMKCVTKAKRRLVLSMCGLGMLDEAEFDTIAPKSFDNGKPEYKDVTPVASPIDALPDAVQPKASIKDRLSMVWKAFHAEKPKLWPKDFYAMVAANTYKGDWIPSDKLTPEQQALVEGWLTTQGY